MNVTVMEREVSAMPKEFRDWFSEYYHVMCSCEGRQMTDDEIRTAMASWQASRASKPEGVDVDTLKRNAGFRDLYKELFNQYCKKNHQLYNAIAPLLGLKSYFGTCNKEQVIWAATQEAANELPAGASIYTYIDEALAHPAPQDVGWQDIETYKGGAAMFYQPRGGNRMTLSPRIVIDNCKPYPRATTHWMSLPNAPQQATGGGDE